MKKIIYIISLVMLCVLTGCKVSNNIDIKIKDKIIIDTQEKIVLTNNNQEINSKEIEWTISNYDVAEINEGILFAKKTGTIVISTIYKGTIYSKKIEIVDPYVEDIIINGETEVIIGKTIKLQATILPSIITSEIEWSSENEEIATVFNGVVKGNKIGIVNIIAKCDDFIKKYLISVIDYPSTLEIKAPNDIVVGEIITLQYNIDDVVIVSSKNEDIVQVENNTLIGINEGVATIEATVKERPNMVSTITIEVSNGTKSIEASDEEKAKIQEIINKMTTNQLVGELFNIRFSKDSWIWDDTSRINSTTGLPDAEFGYILPSQSIVDYMSAYPFGNYTLWTEETVDRAQLQKAINTLKTMGKEKTGVNPFICINYSGGSINGLNAHPDNIIIGEKSIEASYRLSSVIGKEFRSMGINTVINEYASGYEETNYSSNIYTASLQGNSVKNGYKANNIVSAMGTSFSSAYDEKYLDKQKLIQFACINGYEMIDVPCGYVTSPETEVDINFDYVNKVRNEYNYNGVVMLDFTSSGNIYHSTVVEAINNGYDMINYDMCFLRIRLSWRDMDEYLNDYKDQAEKVFAMYNDILQAVENGEISSDRLNEAVSRILLVKLRNNILENTEYSADYKEIADELARINVNYIDSEGIMNKIDRTRSTLIIADNLKNNEDNTLGYILTQYFKETGYSKGIVFSFNTLSFSTIYTTASQYQDIFIYVKNMNADKKIQSLVLVDFVEELRKINPNICIILSGDVSQKVYFNNINNFIYLNNFNDNKYANLINFLDN